MLSRYIINTHRSYICFLRVVACYHNCVNHQKYIRSQVTGALDKLIDSGADLTRGAANLFYVQLLEWACDDENDLHCSQIALDYYDQWKAQPNINP